MNGWKYVGNGVVLLLARKDDFTGVPDQVTRAVHGVAGVAWGDRPGSPLPDHLVGASRQSIEAALGNQGWFVYE